MLLAVLAIAAGPAAAAVVPEILERSPAEFSSESGRVRGYTVAARVTYPYPIDKVLDATHDHAHLGERDRHVKSQEVLRLDCLPGACDVEIRVLLGWIFPFGQLSYDLHTHVRALDDGAVLIEWEKGGGTKLLKHLRGVVRLQPSGPGGRSTTVDLRLEIAAPTMSPKRVVRKARTYLQDIEAILNDCDKGHASLWRVLHEKPET